MIEYSVLDIPSVLNIPFRLKDIIYNCGYANKNYSLS